MVRPWLDDLRLPVALAGPPDRVVSLVPSLTESVAASGGAGLLAGVTDYCTHGPLPGTPRVGGTKNPDVERVIALAPDVVLANEEENRAADLDALRGAGVPVWVTAPRTVPQAVDSLFRMHTALGQARLVWLARAAESWHAPPPPGPPLRAVVPIWRRPWMVLGHDTFAGDVLARLGVTNACGDEADRYPRTTLAQMRDRAPDLVVLPDEPYAFGPHDGPEAFAGWGVPVALVSGRHLTWYGPSLAQARDLLPAQLRAAALPAAQW